MTLTLLMLGVITVIAALRPRKRDHRHLMALIVAAGVIAVAYAGLGTPPVTPGP